MAKSSRARKGDAKEDYASKSYWDSRYEANNIDHEWYYSFDILQPLLSMHTKSEISDIDQALEIGCGDRPLIHKFTELGYAATGLHGVDYSKVVVDKLIEDQKAGKMDSGVHFIEADARSMPIFEANTFSVILDKGTTDAMLSSRSRKEGMNNAKQIFSEVVRMLALNGTFVLVSHMEVESDEFDTVMGEVFMPVLQDKASVNWFVKAHIVENSGPVEEMPDSSSKKGKDKKRKAKDIETPESKGYGTVYTFTSQPKRVTRNKTQKPDVTFEILEYGDDEDEDENFEFLCHPCSSKS